MATMTPTQRFLDGTDAYEEGVEYDDVPDALAAYAARNGWATVAGIDAEPQPQDVTLDIQNVTHEHSATEVPNG